METLTSHSLMEIRENVRRAVCSLEICWRCQKVSECQKHILGNLVLVWLCGHCVSQMDAHKTAGHQDKNRITV